MPYQLFNYNKEPDYVALFFLETQFLLLSCPSTFSYNRALSVDEISDISSNTFWIWIDKQEGMSYSRNTAARNLEIKHKIKANDIKDYSSPAQSSQITPPVPLYPVRICGALTPAADIGTDLQNFVHRLLEIHGLVLRGV